MRFREWPQKCIIHCMLNQIGHNLERYMDLLSIRQKTVASNVANADTPGYRTKDIDFQYEFLSTLNDTRPAKDSVELIEPDSLLAKNDGNNVNMDREMRMLAENAMRFQMASILVRGEFKAIKNALMEGKG